MHKPDWTLRVTLPAITLLLGLIAVRPFFDPANRVLAQSARFDHVDIMSASYLYKGSQGLLMLDRRNGNIWFMPKTVDTYQKLTFHNPVFVGRAPFEKLDQAPQ
jgi:hypothetical protein